MSTCHFRSFSGGGGYGPTVTPFQLERLVLRHLSLQEFLPLRCFHRPERVIGEAEESLLPRNAPCDPGGIDSEILPTHRKHSGLRP